MATEITGLGQPALQPAQARPVANAAVGATTSRGTEPAASDTLTLTDSGRLMQRLEAAVAAAPQVDAQRIERIKDQIASGIYHMNPDQVAAQLVQLEQDIAGPKRDLDFARTDNGYAWDMSTTNARGTRELSVSVGYDAETQTLNRDVTLTGAHGEAASRHDSIAVTESGYTKSFSYTGRDGETVSRTVEASYDSENKSLTRIVTVDGPNHDHTRTTQIARAESGELIHKTVRSLTPNSIT